MMTVLEQSYMTVMRNEIVRIARELNRANRLKALELKAKTGIISSQHLCDEIDRIMGKEGGNADNEDNQDY